MKCVKLLMFPGILIVLLSAFLAMAPGTHAAPAHVTAASSCGRWSIVKSPNVGTNSVFRSVVAVSANDVWATGYYYNSSSVLQTLTEQWNGTQWSVVQSSNAGTSNNYLYGVSSVPGTSDVWTVGSYGQNTTAQKSLTEYYC